MREMIELHAKYVIEADFGMVEVAPRARAATSSAMMASSRACRTGC
jgi:hypothetical protein